MNYNDLAFTDQVLQMQEKYGSKAAYEKMKDRNDRSGLGDHEVQFIEEMDHFFMATIGENNFPYIQHRGGPKGFLKALNEKQIAFIDFVGNKQYISLGNLSTNNKVSLFLISYPHRARLKIYAEAEVVSIEDNQDLFEQLKPMDYSFRPERIIIFNVKAFDWNCPQHITERFTTEEVNIVLAGAQKKIKLLETQNEELKNQLGQAND